MYAFFALTFVTQDVLRPLFGDNISFQNSLGASIVMAVMILPTIASVSEDAMSNVPRELREGAYGLGATRLEVATRVVFPAALPGIIASVLLAISRVIGETMIVAVAAGSTPNLTLSPLEGIQTMTGFMLQVSGGDVARGSDPVRVALRGRPRALRLHLHAELRRPGNRRALPGEVRLMSSPAITPEHPVALKAQGPVARRQALSRISTYVFLVATLLGLFVLAFLAYDVISKGADRLSLDFLTNYTSRIEERAGIRAPVLGTLWVMALVVILAIPIGVGTAVWMEEFAPKNRLLWVIRLNIANLAGVPGIIYGILGLALFVRSWSSRPARSLRPPSRFRSMILPMIVIASAEAIRQVPPSIRDGSLALGATRWQTVWNHVLPGAMPGIMTGTILAVSRAAGETAVLIMIGAAAFIAFDPSSLDDRFTVLPVQIYNWTTRPGDLFKAEASAAIIVLMVFVLGLNLIAIIIRNRFRRLNDATENPMVNLQPAIQKPVTGAPSAPAAAPKPPDRREHHNAAGHHRRQRPRPEPLVWAQARAHQRQPRLS